LKVSKVAGIVLAGAIILGQFAKKDSDKNGIPDITETMTEYFSKYSYREMSNFNPIKPLAIWAGTNKELMQFYKQEHMYDQELKNAMRHIVALAHTTKEYKSSLIARSIGYGKEIFDAFKFDFDKSDWENNEVGIKYVIDNPNCNDEDIMQYAYRYAKDKKLKDESN